MFSAKYCELCTYIKVKVVIIIIIITITVQNLYIEYTRTLLKIIYVATLYLNYRSKIE